jgi:hypothetical protein
VKVLAADCGAACGLAVLEMRGAKATLLEWSTSSHPHLSGLWLTHLPTADLVVVEYPVEFYDRKGMGLNMARRLSDAKGQAKFLAGIAYATGVPCVEVTAADVRGSLFGKRGADDALVAAHLPLILGGVYGRPNSHMRDAAAAGIFGAQRRRLETMTRQPLRAAGGTR